MCWSVGVRKKEAVLIAAAKTMRTQHSLPGKVIYRDTGVEDAKDNQLIRLRHKRQESVQVFIEVVFCLISGGECGSLKRRT
ncbi:unnamed protein product [Dibothriocephalus latus]|uniref:Uncharacterized protein n=1 Tax=Dibothriocephalus latus TaxID=60516 RepID=A0A3P7LFW4_DIBLA|nr:unnamed protein product [Dibothriocephalus latus]